MNKKFFALILLSCSSLMSMQSDVAVKAKKKRRGFDKQLTEFGKAVGICQAKPEEIPALMRSFHQNGCDPKVTLERTKIYVERVREIQREHLETDHAVPTPPVAAADDKKEAQTLAIRVVAETAALKKSEPDSPMSVIPSLNDCVQMGSVGVTDWFKKAGACLRRACCKEMVIGIATAIVVVGGYLWMMTSSPVEAVTEVGLIVANSSEIVAATEAAVATTSMPALACATQGKTALGTLAPLAYAATKLAEARAPKSLPEETEYQRVLNKRVWNRNKEAYECCYSVNKYTNEKEYCCLYKATGQEPASRDCLYTQKHCWNNPPPLWNPYRGNVECCHNTEDVVHCTDAEGNIRQFDPLM